MGTTNICCAQTGERSNLLFTLKGCSTIETPIPLTQQQQAFIDSKNPFPNELAKVVTLKMDKDDLFQGQLDEKGNPTGYGIYKTKDLQSIYFGKFSSINVDGQGIFYVLPDGSYFEGNLMADFGIKGIYVQQQQKYRFQGELQLSPTQQMRFFPHGQGTEKTQHYNFTGRFENGRRVQGKLQWTERNYLFEYEGSFDQYELFTGKGTLKQQTGEYIGDFVRGKKDGKGRYVHNTGLVYEGDYKQGLKHGHGKLCNSDETISYEGEFKDGLPHGKGVAYWEETPYRAEFVEGISKQSYMILKEEINGLSKASSVKIVL